MFQWALHPVGLSFRPGVSNTVLVGRAALFVSCGHSKLLTGHTAPEPTGEEPSLQTSAIFLGLWSTS